MERKATIALRSRARYRDGAAESADAVFEGTLEASGARWRVAYAEPAESGMAGTETVLDITPGRVELLRTGAVRSRLCFAEGERSVSSYETPFGAVTAEVSDVSLRSRLSGHGGLLELRYVMTLGGVESERELRVRVRVAEGEEA